MKKNKTKSSIDFIFYTITVMVITTSLLLKIHFKNECKTTRSDIAELSNKLIHNSDIVKDLQSTRDYFTSYEYISNYLSDKMVVAVPETLIINMNNMQ